jgi:predicted hydrocarbon binding protein
MKRKDFLKGTCGLTALFGSWMAGGTAAFGQEQSAATDSKKAEAYKKNVHGYLKSLMDSMDKNLSEAERTAVQEANGRACAVRGGSFDWAKSFGGDVDKFLAEMRKHIGETNAVRDGRTVRLTYEKCFCPLVADLKEPISPTYCLCTQGWTKAVYEALTGKPVRVALKSSIKRGDPQCLIEVELA